MELVETGEFETMSRSVDEEEHSLEMHLPYIAHAMNGTKYTLVPILVGSTSPDQESNYGR